MIVPMFPVSCKPEDTYIRHEASRSPTNCSDWISGPHASVEIQGQFLPRNPLPSAGMPGGFEPTKPETSICVMVPVVIDVQAGLGWSMSGE